ncbi:MAG: site-specific DNA-methyltransferase [bacterium]|nr:site-specific DNA-methyltransferase [bacterium]
MDKYINKIINGDNVKILKQFQENSIDLSIQSPPYSNLRDYTNEKEWNWAGFTEIAKELYRVTKVGGICVWVVGDKTINCSETLDSFRQAIYFKDECKFLIHDTMIYEKTGTPYPSKNKYYQNFEYMFILSKGKPNIINLIKDKPNSNAGKPAHWGKITYRQKDGSLKEMGENYITPEFGVRTNIWKYKTGGNNVTVDKIAYKHPAIFPEKLAEDHIKSWSNEGNLVLDVFGGSGTTMKIAHKLNRKFIYIDMGIEYCEIASQRFKENFNQEIEIVKI